MLGRHLSLILCCFVLHVACESAGTCVPCEEGMPCFVNVPINQTEVTCPPFSRLLAQKDTQSDNSTECVCNPGFFMADGSCVPCLPGYYCPGFYADARRAVASAPYIYTNILNNSEYTNSTENSTEYLETSADFDIDFNNTEYANSTENTTEYDTTEYEFPEIPEIPEHPGRRLLQMSSSSMVSSLVAYYSFDDWSNLGADSNPSATKYPLTSTIVGGTGGADRDLKPFPLKAVSSSFKATNDGDWLDGSFPAKTIYDNSASGISVSVWFYKKSGTTYDNTYNTVLFQFYNSANGWALGAYGNICELSKH